MEFLSAFHPKVVHFPIAFLLGYFLFELLGILLKKEFLSKAAHLLLLLGVLGALAAVMTGREAEEAFEYWNKQSGELVEEHELYANLTLWYFTGLLVLRTFIAFKKKFVGVVQYVVLLLTIIGVYFIYQTGELGGKMVYEHGVGTEYKIKQMESE
ncbi:MAG: hypothetical protein HXY50_08065 [Ignavibacteriaceae bacterium]|nr:hypothetical protein [Ignavibacteriaceae bacterium]